ncbi:hypothetical protein NXS98_11655 [Fontisphaera persica]|uniref:hypothetical protein n=1 Tax=Fontisphaera persica TaxID=2974023 RepID=UPI0024BF2E3E|nr:hypothetical protein [Fontisphaera persica]WCJ58377.1 hypothetical protein NXS98_11655 [Fontisphaera persica]
MFGGCASRQAARHPPAPPQPYLRVQREPDSTLALQVAVREMVPPHKRWPKLMLVGVTHLGETNYYTALQERLDRCDLVLYEGIGDAPRAADLREENTASLQVRLARALGLVFQLEAIRYDRPHFKNSDLTAEQLLKVLRGEKPTSSSTHWRPAVPLWLCGAVETATGSVSEGMDDLMGIMEGTSFMGVLAHTMVQFIAASPRLQATVKVVLIETMGAIEGDLSESLNVPEEWQALMKFLIQERNNIVLTDVRRLLAEKRPPSSVGIFYGAGHMHDLEGRLAADLGYRPRREAWLTAFSINTRAAGVSEFELNWVRNLIQAQMRPRTNP